MKINIGISEKERKEIAAGLGRVLADTYTLYLKTQNFHWNITGPMFQTLHQLFEKQYEELSGAVDLIAERVRALGYPTPATFTEFLKLSSIKETMGVPGAEEMLRILLDGNEKVIYTARALFAVVDKAYDQPTLDLLAERMGAHEKNAWMLRSFLETATEQMQRAEALKAAS
jgi:starvation-inducible DNA-binding protein